MPLLNIHDFYILHEYQNNGYDKNFLRHIESEAVKNGFCRLTLETRSTNTKALHLYEILGFSGNKQEKMKNIMFHMKKEIR